VAVNNFAHIKAPENNPNISSQSVNTEIEPIPEITANENVISEVEDFDVFQKVKPEELLKPKSQENSFKRIKRREPNAPKPSSALGADNSKFTLDNASEKMAGMLLDGTKSIVDNTVGNIKNLFTSKPSRGENKGEAGLAYSPLVELEEHEGGGFALLGSKKANTYTNKFDNKKAKQEIPGRISNIMYSIGKDNTTEYIATTSVGITQSFQKIETPIKAESITGKGIEFLSRPIGDKHSKVESKYASDEKNIQSLGLSPAEMINHMGSDFMTNKFDAFWMWDQKDIEFSDNVFIKETTDYEKFILNHKGFAVRLQNIEMPVSYNDEYEINFLESKIKKFKSSKVMSNLTKFSFRLDQDLIWLEYFEKFAGRTETRTSLTDNNTDFYTTTSDKFFKNGLNKTPGDAYRRVFKTIAKTWPTHTGEYNIKDFGLCLVIKMTHLGNYLNPVSQQMTLPFVVFENCRILGNGDAIKYQRDAAPQEITVEFIYKRSYIVSPNFIQNGEKLSSKTNTESGSFDTPLKQLNTLSKDDIQLLRRTNLEDEGKYKDITGALIDDGNREFDGRRII
jgi:hypothetical protein